METKDDLRSRSNKQRWRDVQDWLRAFPFLAPSLIVFTIFVFVPLIRSVILSMYGTNPIGQMTNFVGLKYYQRLFTSPDYINSMLGDVLSMAGQLELALQLSQDLVEQVAPGDGLAAFGRYSPDTVTSAPG